MMTSHLGSFFKEEEDFPADDRFGLVPAFPNVSCSCAGREDENAREGGINDTFFNVVI